MQKSGLNIVENSNGSKFIGDDVSLFVLPAAISNEENFGVTNVSFENQILERGKVAEIKATIKNYGENSANKLVHLFVNGKRVSKHVLVNDDIISLGDHRVKFIDPSARRRMTLRDAGWDDLSITRSMKKLEPIKPATRLSSARL